MKKLMSFLIFALLTVMVMVSCDPFTPQHNPIAKLELVQLSSESLSKAFTDNSGQLWLPKSELSSALQKTSEAGIYFGDIKATRTLQYVIMNIGDVDVYDVNLRANDLIIYPNTIDVISASEEGNSIGALPIINIVKEHVIPVEGVGVLLDMKVGPFTDTLILNYSYNIDSDTSIVGDNYIVNGEKKGIIVDLFNSFKSDPISNEIVRIGEAEPGIPLVMFNTMNLEISDSLTLSNSGNEDLIFSIGAYTFSDESLTSDSVLTLSVETSVDIKSIIDDLYSKVSAAEQNNIIRYYIKLGPTDYIINYLEKSYTNGYLWLRVPFDYR